eukprot:Pgem_evm2s984
MAFTILDMKHEFQYGAREQCQGRTKSGKQCNKMVCYSYCFQHEKQSVNKPIKKNNKHKSILMRKRAISEPVTYTNELTSLNNQSIGSSNLNFSCDDLKISTFPDLNFNIDIDISDCVFFENLFSNNNMKELTRLLN